MTKRTDTLTLPDHLQGFRGVDLNLFIIFAAVYELGSVTQAANALGLTQPAVSHALGRLKNSLGDDLFLRHGTSVVPSPFAKRIIDDVRAALHTFRDGPLQSSAFDPATANLAFRVNMDLSLEHYLLPKLLEKLHIQAPRVSVLSLRIDQNDIESELARGGLNLAIQTNTSKNLNLRNRYLGFDHLVTVAQKDSPAVRNGLTPESYLAANHVRISFTDGEAGIEDLLLSQQGIKRKVIAQCSAVNTALKIIKRTDYCLTLGRLQLSEVDSNHNLAVHDFPFQSEEPPLSANLIWHEHTDNDSANRWFRHLVLSCFDN